MMCQPKDCPCCASMLHHCKSCWDKFHNGERDNDYIPPVYYGESMFDLDEWKKEDGTHGDRFRRVTLAYMPIKPNKERVYKEGIYQHEDVISSLVNIENFHKTVQDEAQKIWETMK